MRYSEDGLSLWYGTADAPAPVGTVEAASGSDEAQVSITVGMQPPSASNSVQVRYRVNGGAPATVAAALPTHDAHQQAQYFRAQLPAFRVGDNVEYLVVGRAPGHQVPAAQQAGQFAASFRVVPDPPPEGASAQLHAATLLHPAMIRPALGNVVLAGSRGTVPHVGLAGTGLLNAGTAASASPGTAMTPVDVVAKLGGSTFDLSAELGGEATHVLPGVRVEMPISLRRVPFTLDPLSESGGKITDTLLPHRTAALSKFYLGIDRVRAHLGAVGSGRALVASATNAFDRCVAAAGRHGGAAGADSVRSAVDWRQRC